MCQLQTYYFELEKRTKLTLFLLNLSESPFVHAEEWCSNGAAGLGLQTILLQVQAKCVGELQCSKVCSISLSIIHSFQVEMDV